MKIKENHELDKLNKLQSILGNCNKLEDEIIDYEEEYNCEYNDILKKIISVKNHISREISKERSIISRNGAGLNY